MRAVWYRVAILVISPTMNSCFLYWIDDRWQHFLTLTIKPKSLRELKILPMILHENARWKWNIFKLKNFKSGNSGLIHNSSTDRWRYFDVHRYQFSMFYYISSANELTLYIIVFVLKNSKQNILLLSTVHRSTILLLPRPRLYGYAM